MGWRLSGLSVTTPPSAVIVDRHPLGIAGELRRGLSQARRSGTTITLGFRDILDDPFSVRPNSRGDDWRMAPAFYDQVLIYGHRELCDHNSEYGAAVRRHVLRMGCRPPPATAPIDHKLVVVTAGGGGDGDAIFGWSSNSSPHCRTIVAYRCRRRTHRQQATLPERSDRTDRDRTSVPIALPLYAKAGAVYKWLATTAWPRRWRPGFDRCCCRGGHPDGNRRFRASRLSALGLADVIDHGFDGGGDRLVVRPPAAPRSWAARSLRSRHQRCRTGGEHAPQPDCASGSMTVFKLLRTLAKPYRRVLAIGALLASLEVLIQFAGPWPLRFLVDDVLAAVQIPTLWTNAW